METNNFKNLQFVRCNSIFSAPRAIVAYIGSFLSLEESILLADSNKKVKSDIFSGKLQIHFLITNVANFNQFLIHNPGISSLELFIADVIADGKVCFDKIKTKNDFPILRDFFGKITALELNCQYPDINWFNELLHLQMLEMAGSVVDISVCDKFPSLRKLKLRNYNATFSNQVLSSLPLEELTVKSSPYFNFNNLTLPMLRHITLDSFTTSTIPSFEGCPNLTSIELHRIMPTILEPLSELKQLKEFHLDTDLMDYYPFIKLDFLTNCVSLMKLTLIGINVDSVDPLITCKSLEEICITDADRLVDISALTRLSHLRILTICSENLDICNITTFPSRLEILQLTGKKMNGNIHFTSKLSQLKLDFRNYMNNLSFLNNKLVQDNLTMLSLDNFLLDIGIKYLMGCKELRFLLVGGVTNKNARVFTTLRKLRSICIKYSTFTNLNKLKNCTYIMYINLSDNPHLTDISGIGNFPLLQSIYCENCPKISNFYAFAQCPGLSSITLVNCGIVPLTAFKHCRDLNRLFIDNSIITKEQILNAPDTEPRPILVRDDGYILS